MDKKISVSQIKEVAQEAYEMFKTNTGGKNADYIPYLANIDKNLFGISICLMDGTLIQLGDSEYRFGIESVSKVHTAVLALRQYGAQKLLEMIGADATGLPFNSIMAILLEKDHPSTPLVNAGAITACSMVQPIGDSAKKWDAIVANITDLCGSAPQLIDELYKSESATNFNNRSIAWLLKNYNRIYGYVARSVYPSVVTGNHSCPIVCLRSNDCQRRPEPGIQKADIRRFIVTEDYFADCHRRFLRTYRRLVVHFRYPCKNRCRRWCDGSDARPVRYLSLCPSN